MKNILYCFVLLATSLLHSHNASDVQIEVSEQSIIGKWEFVDLINPDLTKEQYEENKSFMAGAFGLTFKSDKTCIVKMLADISGKWSLYPNTKVITTVDQRGSKIWTIHSLSEKEITISLNDAKQQLIFKRAL